jgi:hypothetical protein
MKNNIEKWQREDGPWITDKVQLKEHVTNYFYNLFSSNAEHDINEILQVVPIKVNMEMNEILCAEYSREEIKHAL